MTQTWKMFALFPLFVLAPYMCPAQKPNVYRLSGDIAGTHDPSIKEGKTWYVFASGKAPGGGQIAVRLFGRSRGLEIVRPRLRRHPSVDS
jgi:hypothetical protein